jgi:hypothetical protein
MNYLNIDVSLTLGEIITRMRAAEDPTGELTNRMGSSIPVFDMHDATHILFGCDTSLEGEIAAHIWMVFGTSVKVGEIRRAVAQVEHRKVLSQFGFSKVVAAWFRMLPQFIGILAQARRMKKRVELDRIDELKKQTIASILDEHGISRP